MRRRAQQAIDAQADALDAFLIEGIRHNIPFLAAVMAHQRWRAGKLSTGFIAEEFPDGFHPQRRTARRADVLAAVAAAIDHVLGERKRAISGQHAGRGGDARARARGLAGRAEYRLEVTTRDGGIAVRFATTASRAVLQSDWRPGDPLWTGGVDGQPVAVQVRPVAERLCARPIAVSRRGRYVYTEREAALCAPDAGEEARGHRQAGAVPDAGPCRIDRRRRRPGGQGRRDRWRWSRR